MTNVECGLISKVISTGNIEIVIEEGITSKQFTGQWRNVFRFVQNYFYENGKVPSKEMVKRYFPTTKFASKKELKRTTTMTWVKELYRKNKHNRMTEGVETIIEKLENLDEEGAEEEFTRTLKAISEMIVGKKDFSLTKNIKALKKDYEKVEKLGGMIGIPTGIKGLDKILCGVEAGQLITIFGKPGTGKTWLLLIILYSMWKMGFNIALGTKEMTTLQMARRLASLHTKIPYKKIRTGTMTKDEKKRYYKGLKEISASHTNFDIFYIKGGLANTRVKVEKYNPDVLAIDGMYLLAKSRDWKDVSDVSTALKELGLDANIPIIGTTQQGTKNKKSSKKSDDIGLEDVMYSDSIVQDSDVVIGLSQTQEMRNDREMDIIVVKQKEGARGSVRINWNLDEEDFQEIYALEEGENRQVNVENPKNKPADLGSKVVGGKKKTKLKFIKGGKNSGKQRKAS
jgi:replicative DNA helicase